ncbi:MAG: hypothetical protein QNJ45_16380 [Ardenticatenaceae bacterium]|nr:hypothetical protein [Ardenticatenaceae bacterium]
MPIKPSWTHRLAVAFSLIALSAVAAFPFFSGDGVPRTNDLVPHLHRAFALKEMVDWGYLWPRWAADLVHGYGYPVFNFFPLLSHWVIVLWHLLGLPLLTAYKMTVWTHYLLGAITSYLLGRTITQRPLGGWLVALIYTFSPYLLYDAVVRGSPPESQALAFLPLVVLGVWHLQQRFSFKWTAITAAAYATMVLSHHPVTLQISFMLGLWIVTSRLQTSDFRLQKIDEGREMSRLSPSSRISYFVSRILSSLGALLLGGLLTAFFALPALLEIDFTRATLSISQGYTYADNFLPLSELFRWPLLPADPARLNPPVVRPLPLVGLLTALLSLPFAWPHLDRPRRQLVGLLGLTGLLGVWLITPSSTVAWEIIPLLEFTLYPWRMLGWVSLIVAILTGVSITALAKSKKVYWFIGVLVTVLVTIEAVPWLFPPREPMPTEITQKIVSDGELPPFLIGTTTLGEFLPAGVEVLPETDTLKAELIDQGNPDRLQAGEGVIWQRLDPDPLNARYTITAEQAATVLYRHFDFPGWRVELNGQEIPINPSQPEGLIAFNLPEGTHDLHIRFGTTPIRTAGNIISALALVVWLGISGYGFLKDHRPQTSDYRWVAIDQSSSQHPTPNTSGLWSLVSGLLMLATFTFFTLIDTPLRRDTLLADGVWGQTQIEPLDFAGELRLLTFSQPDEPIAADEPVELTLFWQAQRGIGVDYAFGIQVVDENGLPWQKEVNRPLDWRFVGGSDIWPPDTYRLEPFEITLLDGTPPGEYRFLVGLVRKDTGQTVAAEQIGGFVVGTAAGGSRPLEPGMTAVGESGGSLTLLGIRPDRAEARPGDTLRLGVLWQRLDDRPTSFNAQLLGEDGQTVWESESIAVPAGAAGDRLRSDQLFRLPASIPAGTLTWQIVWEASAITTTQLNITPLERTFETPKVDITTDLTFGTFARLIGLSNIQPPSPNTQHPTPITQSLTLIWQSLNETSTSYRVFVHLVDEAGEIVAQSDGEPAGWSRPTTGWLPPEYIIDEHTLTLPENLPDGTYRLRIGLYNPQTGERVLSEEGSAFFEMINFSSGS